MKNIWFVVCIFCFSFASCSKHKSGNQLTKLIPKDSTVSSPALFVPHVDTFSGKFEVEIGDQGYTDSESMVSEIFVNHYDSGQLAITGKGLSASYDDVQRKAAYSICDINYYVNVNSTNSYSFHPYRHRYDKIVFLADSLYISISSMPGSCMISELQSFAGKRKQ